MTAVASKAKGTPARKAAKRATANGSPPAPPDAAPPGVVGYDGPPTNDPYAPAPPQEYVPTTAPAPVPVNPPGTPPHPYGDIPVFVFTPSAASVPKCGEAPIVFPHITTIRPDYHFMWKLRKLDQVQQSFEWMDIAKVPDAIQERVTLLTDEDQGKFFTTWFTPAVAPASTEVGLPGES